MIRSTPTRLCALALSALLSACGGGGGGNGGGDAAPAALSSDCSSPVLTQVGTTFQFDYVYSGSFTGGNSSLGSVKRLTTFEGQTDVVEVETDTTNEFQSTGQPAVSEGTKLLSYARRTGNIDTLYGSIATITAGFNQGTVVRTVFSPPFVDERFSLSAGQRQTFTVAGTETSTPPSGLEQVTPVSQSVTVAFIGQEQITVPAGTFLSCRFEISVAGTARPNVIWYHVGNGVVLKRSDPVGTTGTLTSELQATSRLNGSPL